MKRKKKSKGIITVFVSLMLVPMVVCTGTMVDAARLKLYSSQAAMVADSYGEVVLSEYDNLLKDLYGLFSVTQNEEGKQAIKDLAAYTTYSFIPNGDKEEGKKISGFMPYGDAKIDVSYEAIKGAKLSERVVLSTQIGDFMKFRGIAELFANGDAGILSKLSGFENAKKEMEVAKERSQLTDGCMELFEKIGEYYKVLECLNDYPSYVADAEEAMDDYSKALNDVYNRNKFAGYTHKQFRDYIADKKAIDDARDEVARINKEAEKIKKENQEEREKAEKNPKYVPVIKEIPKPTPADEEKAKKWIDDKKFKEALKSSLDNLAPTVKKNLIAFGEVKGKITELNTIAEEISGKITTLKSKAENLEKKLKECGDDSILNNSSMHKEIDMIKEVSKAADDFSGVVNYLGTIKASNQDTTNKSNWEKKVSEWEKVEKDLLTGETLNTGSWPKKVSLGRESFRPKYNEFYQMLEEMCTSKKTSSKDGADADAGNKKIDDANKKAANKTAELEEAEKKELEEKKTRSIGDTLAGQLIGHSKETENDGSSMPNFLSLLTGDANVGTLANTMINKFLLITYDFGMFSDRVTSVKPPEKEEETSQPTPTASPTASENEKKDEEYKEYSLTKVEKSKDVNYLYEAELEYLIAGKTDSKKNLNFTRNIISTVRMSMNFIATYSIKEINTAIESISASAEAAVAATVVGAPLAPMVYVAVNGALRALVATLESVADWNLLKAREEVLFYKKELGDLNTLDIGNYLKDDSNKQNMDVKNAKKSAGELKFSYEDYLYIMLIFVDDDDLLDRTANLITLNVNQSQNDTGKDLKNLNFKMTDTVTAIKSTCTVDLKFMIVPENMSNMFLNYGGAPEDNYKQTIQKLDDGSYAYSVIRGY